MTDDIRDEIAQKAGLPADALRGNTRDELQAHADQLTALGYSRADLDANLTAAEVVEIALGRTTRSVDGASELTSSQIVDQITRH